MADEVPKEIPPLTTPEVVYYDNLAPSGNQNEAELVDDFELQFPIRSDVTTSPYIVRASASPRRSPSPRRRRSPSPSRRRTRNRSRSLELQRSRRRSPVRRSRSVSFSDSSASSSSSPSLNRRRRRISRRRSPARRGYVLGSRTVRVGPNQLLHKYGNHSITFVTEGGAHIRNKKIPNKACRYLLSHCSRRHPTARDKLPRQARIVLRKRRVL